MGFHLIERPEIRTILLSAYLLLALLTALPVRAQLVPAQSAETGLWGYQKKGSKKWTVPPTLLQAMPFEHGVGVVRNQNGFFLMDKTGTLLHTTPFDTIGWPGAATSTVWKDGYTAANTPAGWKLLGKEGRISVETFHYIRPFSPGLFEASAAPDRKGIVGPDGAYLIPAEFNQLVPEPVLQGIRAIRHSPADTLCGLFGTDGTPILPPIYADLRPAGRLIAALDHKSKRWGLFTPQGQQVQACQLDQAPEFDVQHLRAGAWVSKGGRFAQLSAEGKLLSSFRYRVPHPTDSAQVFPAWHLANTEGTMLLHTHADTLWEVLDSLFVFQAGTKYGLTDPSGTDWLYGQYDSISAFSATEGLLVVSRGGHKGLIRPDGSVVLSARFASIRQQAGLIAASLPTGGIGLFNLSGTELPLSPVGQLGPFREGRMGFVRNGRYGFADSLGNVAVQPVFLYASDFTAGLAVVKAENEGGVYAGLIDREGQWVIRPVLDSLRLTATGLPVFHDNGLVGTLDRQGIEWFREEGHLTEQPDGALIWKRGRMFGLVGPHGHMVLDAEADSVWAVTPGNYLFSRGRMRGFQWAKATELPQVETLTAYNWLAPPAEGLVRAQRDGLFGMLDPQGRIVISFRYDSLLPMHEGLAPVRMNRRWGYLTRQEIFSIQPLYEEALPFKNGVALTRLKGKWGLIDRQERTVLPHQYHHIWPTVYGNWLVTDHTGMTGIYTRNGKRGIYPRYEGITDTGTDYVVTYKNNKYGVDRMDGYSVFFPFYDAVYFNPHSHTFWLVSRPGQAERR